MKTRILILVLAMVTLLLQNCSKDHQSEITEESAVIENKELFNMLINYGFQEDQIVDMGDYYQVNGDINFNKDSEYNLPKPVGKLSETSLTDHRHSTYTVSQANRDITVAFHSSVNTDWTNAANDAISEWNAICNVYLNVITNYAGADIQIYTGTGGLASAGFPNSSGEPGDHIKINQNFVWTATQDKRISVMVHEFGHALGLLHSYDYADFVNGCTKTSTIPGTPDCEGDSVMRWNFAGRPWSLWGFTNYDKIAAKWLFPYPYMTPNTITLNTQQAGDEISITGTGPVTVSLSGGSGLYLNTGLGGSFQTTLYLTAPTNFNVYGPGIGAPGYTGGVTYVNLTSPNKGIVDVTTVTHSN